MFTLQNSKNLQLLSLLIMYNFDNSQLKQMLQPQQPQQPSFCFHSSSSLEFSQHHDQSSESEGGLPSTRSQLAIQLTQCQQKLHRLTLIQEEQQQIATTSINQIISYQGVVDCVRDLADHYGHMVRKKIHLASLKTMKEEKQRALILISRNSEDRKTKIKVFRQKMQIHILDGHNIKNLLAYSRTHNIHKIVEQCMRSNIHEIIHSTHPCTHNNSTTGFPKNLAKYKDKCAENCRYGELLQFIAAFKSTKLCSRIQQMWKLMEKEVFREVSGFVRMYGEELMNDNGLAEKEQKLQKQVMDVKVDLQITKNQINHLLQQIGIEDFQDQVDHNQYLIQQVMSHLKQQKAHEQSSQYDLTENDIRKLSRAFCQYVKHIEGSYQQEYSWVKKEELEDKITEAAFDQINRSLSKAIKSSEHRLIIQEQIEKVQKNIHRIQLQSEQARVQEQKIQLALSWSKQTQQTRNLTSKLRVNRRYQIEGMRFRVIKIMHISAVGLTRNIGSASYAYSKGSSRVSAASQAPTRRSINSSMTTITTDRSVNNQYSQRILEFGKGKLILRKENPHFHEYIEIKRITVIKIRSQNLLHIYFRKGYMSLEFIQCENGMENMARSWVELFQVVYYDYVGQIEYDYGQEYNQNDKENELVKSNLIIQQQNYRISTSKQNIDNFITFQNSKKISTNSII